MSLTRLRSELNTRAAFVLIVMLSLSWVATIRTPRSRQTSSHRPFQHVKSYSSNFVISVLEAFLARRREKINASDSRQAIAIEAKLI